MRKIASIDIGSNSILLLVASITKTNRLIPILQESRTPRLAENLRQAGIISSKSLNRAIRDLNHFKNLALREGCEEIYAVATQAVRQAGNKLAVLERIYRETGITVEVVSGRQEALLTYRGALTGIRNLKNNKIVFDIGGASSEFVFSQGDIISQSFSVPIGAVELTEKYRTDRVTAPQNIQIIKADMKAYLGTKLKSIDAHATDLIGCGGTISTYKLLAAHPRDYDPSLIHGRTLSLKTLVSQINSLASLKLSRRKGVIIFEPARANVIVAGGILLLSILEIFNRNSLKVSTRNLRWGFLISKL